MPYWKDNVKKELEQNNFNHYLSWIVENHILKLPARHRENVIRKEMRQAIIDGVLSSEKQPSDPYDYLSRIPKLLKYASLEFKKPIVGFGEKYLVDILNYTRENTTMELNIFLNSNKSKYFLFVFDRILDIYRFRGKKIEFRIIIREGSGDQKKKLKHYGKGVHYNTLDEPQFLERSIIILDDTFYAIEINEDLWEIRFDKKGLEKEKKSFLLTYTERYQT